MRVETVDSFQGKESDIVLLSLVRTNSEGFWNDERRLNVALTRARHALRVFVSNSSLLKSGTFAHMFEDATRRELVD